MKTLNLNRETLRLLTPQDSTGIWGGAQGGLIIKVTASCKAGCPSMACPTNFCESRHCD